MSATIAIANAKGGCGKTTTVLHLAVAFAEQGLDVLAVDVDPQGTLTRQLGVVVRGQPTVKEVLIDGVPLEEAVVPARPRLDVLGADLRLAAADLDLAAAVGGDTRLRRALRAARHDLVLIDCPPAIGKLTVNALVAAGAFLVPLEPSQYSLEGLDMLQPTVRAVRENYTPDLAFLGPVLVMAEPRTVVTKVVREQLEREWGDLAFRTVVRKSQRTKEVAFTRDTLFDAGEMTTTGADYLGLAAEIADRLGLPATAQLAAGL
ncbi:MAG: Chromosome (plasmid) partitioning protein ParA / Sporulation initiation inhibitor protein Soj [uncultured Thermomicrobiales bacterium]|uniref:Chromosome (Plasmid) partitioning protein ParA / Sporulation initiation inhibitor protein Soj n=1 Tax=uncultured Thermomicrobiales bacterium TaxID=1645740 RepID=A0A6J4UWL3_9BACT|nr:MAG: Chromosome (plasmid) partitioning protein ParA / Sporulation initiation inhibitor protein Soj [uncultured Thermomicrobiales bacterium]